MLVSRPQYKDQELDFEAADDAVVCTSSSNIQEIQESSDDLEMDEDTTVEPTLKYAKKSKLLEEISRLKTENEVLSTMLSQRRRVLSYEALVLEPKLFLHYTGMTPKKFESFYDIFRNSNINYFHGWKVESLDKQNQVLLFLLKIKYNFTFRDLAYRFDVSVDLVENVVLTWLHKMHKKLFVGCLCKRGIPGLEENQKCLPSSFKDYSDCRIILDCIAFDVQGIIKTDATGNIYEPYEVKALFGIAPNGCITFASKLYPTYTSIKEIVIDSKILDHMVPGDCIIADEQFLPIRDILPTGVTLNTSPFNSSSEPVQNFEQEQLATIPTLLDMVIHNIDLFKILYLIPVKLERFATMVWQVCFYLSGAWTFSFPRVYKKEEGGYSLMVKPLQPADF
ncbi:hypothetical protein B566_EDAN003592 [Ephemera danica]|nr:hypothetical protein B566_EDAN003592 [Ephemera danica]